MLSSIIMLLALMVIMLGMIGKRSKDIKRSQQTLNQAALDALQEQRLVVAFQNFEKSASIGNARAAFWCGLFFVCGYIDYPDYKMASVWFTRASNKRNLSATVFIALMMVKRQLDAPYDRDAIINALIYVVTNYEKRKHTQSVEDLLKSSTYAPFSDVLQYDPHIRDFYALSTPAQQDAFAYAHAMYLLGHLFQSQALEDADEDLFSVHAWHNALMFFSRCEQLGYLDSALNMAHMFEVAATTQNSLLTLPAGDAMSNAGMWRNIFTTCKYQACYDYTLTKQLLDLPKSELWHMAFTHYETGARQHPAQAQFELGEHYLKGIGVAADPKLAISYFQASGTVMSCLRLGEIFNFGIGVPVDGGLAVEYYTACNNLGESEANANIQSYGYGYGGYSYGNPRYGRNPRQPSAVENSEFAIKRQEINSARCQAIMGLANIYRTGLVGIPANPVEEFNWLRKAAYLDLAAAQVRLASMFASGIGVEQNLTLAVRWYAKAAGHGNQEAVHALYQLQDIEPELVRENLANNQEFMESQNVQWVDQDAEVLDQAQNAQAPDYAANQGADGSGAANAPAKAPVSAPASGAVAQRTVPNVSIS